MVLLLAPLATQRTFASDWGNHLWLVYAQGENIRSLGLPSYYLQSTLGVFYPYYAFYGGTVYAVLGYGSWLVGANAAVVVGSILALTAAYLSWTWIAIQVGIRGWLIQIPGLLAVTAPYAVSVNLGRGGIPERVGCFVIALIAASGLSIFRAERLRVGPAIAFVAGLVFLTGSHVLTMVWGVTLLAVVGAIMVAADWRAARRHARRALRLVWLAALGLAINAWILVPILLYHGRVQEGPPDPLSQLEYTDSSQLFSFVRDGAHLNPVVHGDVNAQLPLLMIVWTFAALAFYWSRLGPALRRLAVGLILLAAAFLLLIMAPSLIPHLPTYLTYVQFPHRLMTYLDLVLVGVTTLAIAAMQRAGLGRVPRLPAALLAVVAALSLGAAVKQTWDVRSWLPDRATATASAAQPPESWYTFLQFADASAPIVKPSLPGTLEAPVVADGIRDSYTATAPPGRAGTVLTNVDTAPYFVTVDGAKPVGRDEVGHMVVSLHASNRPRRVTFSAHWGTGVDVGIWLTVAALAVAALALIWALADPERRRRLRRGHPPVPGQDG